MLKQHGVAGSDESPPELINISYQNLFLDIGFIKVIGKASKERLVPIGSSGKVLKGLDGKIKPIRPTLPVRKRFFSTTQDENKQRCERYIFI